MPSAKSFSEQYSEDSKSLTENNLSWPSSTKCIVISSACVATASTAGAVIAGVASCGVGVALFALIAIAAGGVILCTIFTRSSERKTTINAKKEATMHAVSKHAEVSMHAKDKELAMKTESNRHEEAMVKLANEKIAEDNRHEETMVQAEFERERLANKGLKCSLEDCEAFFQSTDSLVLHVKRDHRKYCGFDGCEAYFDNLDALKLHFRQHNSGSMLPCSVDGCNALFSSSKDLCQHVQRDHKITPIDN